MTKKDYRVIAAGLRNAMPSRDPLFYQDISEWRIRHDQWETIVDSVADALEADNLRFERVRFVAACRGEN